MSNIRLMTWEEWWRAQAGAGNRGRTYLSFTPKSLH